MTIPEKAVWKPIPGYPGYFANRDGEIFGKKGLLTPNKGRAYDTVMMTIDGKQYRKMVHRLIALTFIPNPKNLPMVNHKDENKRNNASDNLEWCDSKYNNNYGENVKRGREKVALARSESVIKVDGNKIIFYNSLRDAERETGINRHCISRACRGIYKSAGGCEWRYAE